ncbi:MAG: leucine-rich repeat protein [Lachnospiraceae bacterium]|nr:leucine-rich repeat protein [Lachnospiraceae bacterium]
MQKTIKHAALSLVCFAITLFTLSISANAADSGKNWTLDDNGVLTISGGNNNNTLDENGATWLTSHKSDIKEVVIEKVVNFDGELFKDCVNLTKVIFSDKGFQLTNIDGETFAGCTSLKEITLPKSLKAGNQKARSTNRIATGPFASSGLEKVTFADGTEKVADYILSGCKTLKEVTIPSSVNEIGIFAFANCEGLTSVTFPAGLKKIDGDAFYNCLGLTEVTLPKSIETYAGGGDAFNGSKNIKKVVFEDGLTTIPDEIFKGCIGITEIKWPSGLKAIGKEAFYDAYNYTVADIPDTVTAINSQAFWRCKITSFTVPKKMTTYKSPFQNIKEITFEDGTAKIPDGACDGASFLEKVNFPKGLKEVGDYAFHVVQLKEIILPDTVTKVGKFGFSTNKVNGCTIYIPKSLKTYDSFAFDSMAVNPLHYRDVIVKGEKGSKAKEICEKKKYTYKEIVIPKKGSTYTVGDVKYKVIETGKVNVCGFKSNKLTSVTIPKSVKIGDLTFTVCGITKNTFKGMSKVKKVTVKSTAITKVEKKAFAGLNAKASIKVPKANKKKYTTLFTKAGLSKKIKIS